MLKFVSVMNTLRAGDFYEAAVSVGGTCSIGKCDARENCKVECIIPRNRIEDFTTILEEKEAI